MPLPEAAAPAAARSLPAAAAAEAPAGASLNTAGGHGAAGDEEQARPHTAVIYGYIKQVGRSAVRVGGGEEGEFLKEKGACGEAVDGEAK
jgi:hypothetical protein